MQFQTFGRSIAVFPLCRCRHLALSTTTCRLVLNMHRNTSKLRRLIAHIRTLCPLALNVHILVSHFWCAASWRTLCSSPKLFWSYCEAFIMLSAPACCCSVQIITAHMVIHNHHHKSLVALRHRPHSLTLSPSMLAPPNLTTPSDQQVVVVYPQYPGGRWVNSVYQIKSRVHSPLKPPGFLFSLLSSISLHISLWSFLFFLLLIKANLHSKWNQIWFACTADTRLLTVAESKCPPSARRTEPPLTSVIHRTTCLKCSPSSCLQGHWAAAVWDKTSNLTCFHGYESKFLTL